MVLVSVQAWKLFYNDSSNIAPSLQIPGEYQWKRIDTELCRVYFYQDDDFVKEMAVKLDAAYSEVCKKFKHTSIVNKLENGLICFYFLMY